MDSSNWVWIPEWENRGQTKAYLVCFRRKFMADARQEEMKIQISADSRYKLYVNGKLAEIGPCKGDRLIWYYDEVDIAPFLKVGENILAVEVLRYPVNGWGNHSIIRTHTPGMMWIQIVHGGVLWRKIFRLFRNFHGMHSFRFWKTV